MLQTDLSAAYDTIDHQILINKLQFYGVEGDSLNIIKNYLSNRYQFVQVDTFSSSLIKSLDCSVIQGSKLSSLLYILYTNEIPNLHKFISDKNLQSCYNKLTKNKFKLLHDKITDNNFNHLTINFIDDSTNLISNDNSYLLIDYLTVYYDLLQNYYDINKLTINPDKTELLVSCKNILRADANKIKFQADIYLISQKENTKILGFIINNKLNHDKHINTIISKINLRLHTINIISRYMNNKIKIMVTNSLVISIIKYVLPLLININKKQLNIINVLINKAARNAIGYHSYWWSNDKILKYCNWLNGTHSIYYTTLVFVHKINFEMLPEFLVENIIFNKKVKNTRYTKSPVSNINKSKSSITGNSLLFKGILLYNKLDPRYKVLNISKFKKEIKLYIKEKLPPDRIVGPSDYS